VAVRIAAHLAAFALAKPGFGRGVALADWLADKAGREVKAVSLQKRGNTDQLFGTYIFTTASTKHQIPGFSCLRKGRIAA